jgi:hypothetical protein
VADKFVRAESARSAGGRRTEIWVEDVEDVEDVEGVRLVEVEADHLFNRDRFPEKTRSPPDKSLSNRHGIGTLAGAVWGFQ